jgi:predicted O-methyltransferase YrrM
MVCSVLRSRPDVRLRRDFEEGVFMPHRILFSFLLAAVLPLAGCADDDVHTDVTPSAVAAEPQPFDTTVDAFEDAALRKDVPYVPTPQGTVEEMLRMAKVSRNQMVYDLGSGDGRIVITAARDHGARGVGVDIDPQRIREANENAKEAKVTDRVRFVQGDLFATDLREADVVTLYLLRSVNLRLRPKLLEELRPGTPVVSHDFDMGEWEPDETRRVGGDVVYLWIVPARVDGRWQWSASDGTSRAAELQQDFQKFTGRTQIGNSTAEIREGTLNGDQISFEITRDGVVERYQGRVSRGAIEGTVESGGRRAPWRAQRG